MNKYLSGKTNSITLGAIAALICLGLFFLNWYLFIPDIKLKMDDSQLLEAEIKDLQAKQEKLNKSRKLIGQLTPSLNRLELGMPQKAELPELIVMLDAIATESGLSSVTELNPTQTIDPKATEYQKININFSGLGTYESLITFLDNIHLNIRPIRIESLNMSSSDEEGQENLISFNFIGVTYVQTESEKNPVPASSNQPVTDQNTEAQANQSAPVVKP